MAASPGGDKAVRYYLSLGDSLAAGQQPIGDPADMYRTSDGYTDQLYDIAKKHSPKLQHVKLGCPGETTVTMIGGGGPCTFEEGSQLNAAVAFLEAHPGRVSFITIDIGWNDLDVATPYVIGDPAQAQKYIEEAMQPVGLNLPVILTALQTAAPGVPIIGMNMYDPFLGLFLTGQGDLAQLSVPLVTGVNGSIAAIYAFFGVPVADVETAFRTTAWTPVIPVPGLGDVPLNVATICVYTWICAPAPLGPDNHATHFGYHAMALAFADQLGL